MNGHAYTYLVRAEAQLGDIVRRSTGTKLYRIADHVRGPAPRVLLRGVDSGGAFWVDGDTSLVLVEPVGPIVPVVQPL